MPSVKPTLTHVTNALLVSDDKLEIVLRMISEREKRLAQLDTRPTNAHGPNGDTVLLKLS